MLFGGLTGQHMTSHYDLSPTGRIPALHLISLPSGQVASINWSTDMIIWGIYSPLLMTNRFS